MRCLVIEDEADTARYISNGVKEEGFTVVWSRDGLDGLNLATGERWDVVILDRLLPGGIDGLSILQAVRHSFGSDACPGPKRVSQSGRACPRSPQRRLFN